jgi:hypothetical protein
MREKELLIRIAAATDGIFRPQRSADWAAPGPSNIYEARRRFPVAGVALPGGGSGAERVAAHQRLADLREAGLVTLYGGGRCRLTETGDHLARALCGLPGVVDSHAMMQKVIALTATAGGLRLCSELSLCGLKNYRPGCQPALYEVSLRLAPALAWAWCESRSDIHGRAFYLLTDAGREAAKLPAATMPAGLPGYDDAANELYHRETLAARERLRTAKPSSPSEIGCCPLPASLDLRRRKTAPAANVEIEKIQQDAISESRRMRKLAAACDRKGNRKGAAACRSAALQGEELARKAAAVLGGTDE